MEGGWHFPASYEAWRETQVYPAGEQRPESPEPELENGLITNDLLVSQPLVIEETHSKPKKKKKRRPVYYDSFYDSYNLKEQVIGRGANSLVTLATRIDNNKEYAVKVIEKVEGYDRGRVLREIDLLHFLKDCPNVLHLQDSYEDKERFFLIFERMEGGPLLDHIKRRKAFTEREASLVVKEICKALAFLHEKGIAHRDLKPENILCEQEEQIIPIVICDFNLASGISDAVIQCITTPELYTPVGSAEYMAPEVVDAFVGDAGTYDKRCDLWSLGVILYIMLSGHPPFQGNCGNACDWEDGGSCRECQSLLWHSILDAEYSFPEREWGHVSVEAKDLISHLLVKEANKRYTVESVLNHPWLEMASNNMLNTPEVLASDRYTSRLSAVTSEAIAYRRIISERQSSEGCEDHHVITRWSTPPKFGLSPPGKSKLAKRRSLKNKLSSLSIDLSLCNNGELKDSASYTPESPSNTPIQSPDIGRLIEDDLKKRLAAVKTSPDQHSKFQVTQRRSIPNLRLDGLTFDNDDDKTPMSTPRAEESHLKVDK